MGARYWVAAFANVLGGFLGLAAMAVAMFHPAIPARALACFGMFWIGWGTYRLRAVMEEEYRARYPLG